MRQVRLVDDQRLAHIARRQCGVVSTAQLMACGLSPAGIAKRVAGARLFRVRRVVYSLGPCVDEWGLRWAAILATSADRAVLSHWSAGEVHRMVEAGPPRVHVTVPGGGRRDLRGIVVHRSRALSADDVAMVRGLRVTTPERTALDIAGVADDAAVRRMIREGEFHGVLPTGAICAAIGGRTGHRGLGRLQRMDPATHEAALAQTPLEDDLEDVLRPLTIPGLCRQHHVRGSSGSWFRVDFSVPEVRLAIEADGRTAHERSSTFESDRARDADLGAVGWQTLRFTRIQVHTTPEVVRSAVERTVHLRGARGGGAGLAAA
jgi:very-short-patch-repair endonuclease